MNYFKKPVASADLVVNFVNDFSVNLDGVYALGDPYHGAESKDWVYHDHASTRRKPEVLFLKRSDPRHYGVAELATLCPIEDQSR